MKTLIIYTSKYGCTADCATYLKSKLSSDITLIDAKNHDKKIELEQFDTVIMGSSIYMGRISKELHSFCEENLEILCQKKIGLFLCCGLADQLDEFLTNNFPSKLIEHAQMTVHFGSKARLEKMKFFDKCILRAVTKGDFSPFKILYENIEKFAEVFNSY